MLILPAAFTIINLASPITDTGLASKYFDIYKSEASSFNINRTKSTTIINKYNQNYVVLPTLPANLLSIELARNSIFKVAPIGFSELYLKPSFNYDNDLGLAFDKIFLNRNVGDQLVDLAKGILAEMSYTNVNVTPYLVTDPEERNTSLNIQFMLNVSFIESLTLDTALSKQIISRSESIPDNILFSVHPLS